MTEPITLGGDAPVHHDHPAATTEQNAVRRWAHDHPIDHPTLEVRNGRYRATVPGGDKERSYTRASGYGSALDDTATLETWRRKLIIAGLIAEPALLAAAATGANPATVATDALERAGVSIAADVGTAIHLACEWAEAGDMPAGFPDAYAADVAAYTAALDAAGLTVTHTEPTAVTPIVDDETTIGRIDRIVTCPDGKARALDIKTGSSVDRLGYAVQLAIYAHATHHWTGTEWTPAPEVDHEVAYLAHMPAGSGTCEIVAVDIATGWERAIVAARVRQARRGVSKLFTPLAAVPAATNTEPEVSPTGDTEVAEVPFPATAPTTRDEWITGRIDTLTASTAARGLLRQQWPTGCPKRAPWTPEQHTAIIPVLDSIESAVEAPFPHNDPEAPEPTVPDYMRPPAGSIAPEWPEPDNGAEVHRDEVAPLLAAFRALPDDRRALIGAWSDQGRNQGRRWGRASSSDPWTERATALVIAAMRCATHLWTDDDPDLLTRAALEVVIGEEVQPTWTTGAVIGSLTIAQAHRLDEIASLGNGDTENPADVAAFLTRAA